VADESAHHVSAVALAALDRAQIAAASDHPRVVGPRGRGIHVLVSVLEDATMALLALVDETAEHLIDLLAEMWIAGLGLSTNRSPSTW
jgi:hypothetical protein